MLVERNLIDKLMRASERERKFSLVGHREDKERDRQRGANEGKSKRESLRERERGVEREERTPRSCLLHFFSISRAISQRENPDSNSPEFHKRKKEQKKIK